MSYSSNGTPEARSSSSPARRFDRRDSTPIIRDEVVALNNAALHGVGPKDAGLATGVENTFIQLGGSLGLSVLVTLALRHAANRVGHGVSVAVATTDGYRFALRIAVGLGLLAALLVAVALERVTFVPPDELAVVVARADAG